MKLRIFVGMSTGTRIVLWSARISGSLALGFLLFMLAGHLFGRANGPVGMRFASGQEVLLFALFPVCVIAGLLLAYRHALLGGGIVLASMAVVCILRPWLVASPLPFFALPGLLYAVYAWMARHPK